MRLEMFTPDLANRHEITHAISVQAEELYNGIAKFTVVLPMTGENIALSQVGAVLYLADRRLAYEVAEVQADSDKDELTLNGFSLNSRIDRRVIASAVKIVNVETDVYAAVSANLRGMTVALSAAKGLQGTVTETTLSGTQLLTAVMPLLDSVQLGQRAVFDYRAKSVTWEIYQGTDRTGGLRRVVFCEEQGTAPGLVIDRDVSKYKNVCYCKAKYSAGTEFVTFAGDASGDERREMWVDFSGDAQASGETNAAFLARVQRYAAVQLLKNADRLGFTVDANADELGSAYSVGDLVCCVSLRAGVTFTARITGATFSQDANGQTTKLTMGDPILTVLEA